MAITFPSSPSAGNTFVHGGTQFVYKTSPNRWDGDGFVGYNPFRGFEGPFSPSITLPAHNAISWVSPGNGSARFFGFAPDSTGEPVFYPSSSATTGGWWSIAENYSNTNTRYTAGYFGLTLPNRTDSPLAGVASTDDSGTLRYNPTASFSEIASIDYYNGDSHLMTGRTSAATDYIDFSRYDRYSTRPTGADSTQLTLTENSTASINFQAPYNVAGESIDGFQNVSSAMFAAADRIEIEITGNASELGTDPAGSWTFRRGNLLGTWYFQSGSGTQTSNNSNATVNNHDRVQLYELYYEQTA